MDAPVGIVEACRSSHARLLARLAGLDDATARRASQLGPWSVGHVLTHLARNADSLVRVLAAALEGRSERQYAEGPAGARSTSGPAPTGRRPSSSPTSPARAAGSRKPGRR